VDNKRKQDLTRQDQTRHNKTKQNGTRRDNTRRGRTTQGSKFIYIYGSSPKNSRREIAYLIHKFEPIHVQKLCRIENVHWKVKKIWGQGELTLNTDWTNIICVCMFSNVTLMTYTSVVSGYGFNRAFTRVPGHDSLSSRAQSATLGLTRQVFGRRVGSRSFGKRSEINMATI
jgi:hypothetical protein